MKKWFLLTLIVLLGWAVGSSAQTDIPDEELLQAMDFARFGAFFATQAPSTTFTVEIVADRPDGTKQAVVQVSFNLEGFARIDYLSPEELAGDVFVVTPEEIFFWNPDLITPLKVNGRFEVFGDATVAEVVGIGFSGVYSIKERKTVSLEDGAPGIEVLLEAAEELRNRVGFPTARVVANAETLQPITLELFALSGDLLHFNTFEAYAQTESGAPYFETQLLDNRIVPVNKTLLTVTNIQNKDLPAETFDPTQLGA